MYQNCLTFILIKTLQFLKKLKDFKEPEMRKIEPFPSIKLSTLRDISFKALGSKEITALLNKINEEYYYWDKVKHQPIPTGIDHKQIWAVVKLRRRNTPYNIALGKYQFHWNLNSKLQGYLHFLDMNIGGTLESYSRVTKEEKTRYLLSSIMEEAIASSQIEGAATTRKHAKEMLRKNIKPRNKDEQMIHNNYITIQKILEVKSEPLTLEGLLDVHRWITYNTMLKKNEEGFLRDTDDIKVIDTSDGTVLHQPPPLTELPELLKDLIKFFNEDDPKLFVHPIVKACIVHFALGFIHPFVDGNGRTARALFYWYLLKRGYWLTEYISISRLILKSKPSYARAFQYSEIDENDLTYFISYNLRTMQLAFEELRTYIRIKNEEKKQLTDFVGIDGLSHRQALILEWFRNESNLLITITETSKRLGVSYMSARSDLAELHKKKYLSLTPLNKVLKGYLKGERFDLLLQKTHKKARRLPQKPSTDFIAPTLFDWK